MSNIPAAPHPTAEPSPADRIYEMGLFTVAIALRIVVIAAIMGLATGPEPDTDEEEYDVYAWNVARGRGYRGLSPDVADQDHLTAYRPPVPSLFYAAIYWAFGHSFAAANVGTALLGGATAVLLGRVACRCFGVWAGRMSGLAFAVYPASLMFGMGIKSEAIAAFLVVLVVWCSLGIRDRRGLWWAIGTGLSFGLLLLSKPGFLFALPFLPIWAWIVCGREMRLWSRAATIPAAMGLVMLPWVLRNALVFGGLIPFGTGGGQLMAATSNRYVVGDPLLYGYSVMDDYVPEYAPALHAAGDEIRRDAAAKRMAMDWLKANPDKWFYLARSRFLRQWTPFLHRPRLSTIEQVTVLVSVALLTLFVAALPWATSRFLRDRDPALMMHALILGNTIMAMIFHGQPRYRYPTDPLCIAIAAGGVSAFLRTVRSPRGPAIVASSFFGALSRHRLLAGAFALVAVGLAVAVRLDNRHIEEYRTRECNSRLDEIERAVASFREKEGHAPGSLEELLPRYLPNLDALHCPRHSIAWHDYLPLAGIDHDAVNRVVSYEITSAGADGCRVQENQPRHNGSRPGRSITFTPAEAAGATHPRTP